MLRRITPNDLVFEWERVRHGLEICRETTSDDWLPEDVYMAIKSGNAALYVGEDDGDYLGFLVVQLLPMFHGARLHVWCAYSATDKPLMREYMQRVREIAQAAGAKKITFSSTREEWVTVSKRLGFKVGQTNFEMEV